MLETAEISEVRRRLERGPNPGQVVRFRLTPRWWRSADDRRIGSVIVAVWRWFPAATIAVLRERVVVRVELAADATVRDFAKVRAALRADVESIARAS